MKKSRLDFGGEEEHYVDFMAYAGIITGIILSVLVQHILGIPFTFLGIIIPTAYTYFAFMFYAVIKLTIKGKIKWK